MRLLPLLLLFAAILMIGASQASGAFGVATPDEDGANDVPGQKDLSSQNLDDSGLPNSIRTQWNWDELSTNGNNTLDACSLLDSDGDGFANFAVCGTTKGTAENPIVTTTTLYSCGDTRVDRCSSQLAVITGGATDCESAVSASDPFPGPPAKLRGANYPNDLQATCDIILDDFDVAATSLELLNTCSYPSQQPNSDPSDCIVIPRDATLTIVKDAGSNTTTVFDFDVRVNTSGSNTLVEESITGSGSVSVGIIGAKPNSVEEALPSGWVLSSASCTGGTNNGTLSGQKISGIVAATGTTVTCTFVNEEPLATPTASTSPSVIPQDSATLSGIDASGDGGDLDLELYTDSGCTGTLVYSDSFADVVDGTYNTDNDGTAGALPEDGYSITADGDFFWRVHYEGDSRNDPIDDCNESVNVDLTASS